MIKVEELDQRVVLRLPNEFIFSIYNDFRNSLRNHPAAARYELDMGKVTAIDSTALGMLLLLRTHCGEDDASIVLANCNPEVKKFLELANLGNQFSIN